MLFSLQPLQHQFLVIFHVLAVQLFILSFLYHAFLIRWVTYKGDNFPHTILCAIRVYLKTLSLRTHLLICISSFFINLINLTFLLTSHSLLVVVFPLILTYKYCYLYLVGSVAELTPYNCHQNHKKFDSGRCYWYVLLTYHLRASKSTTPIHHEMFGCYKSEKRM